MRAVVVVVVVAVPDPTDSANVLRLITFRQAVAGVPTERFQNVEMFKE
jgi:hypothetical protein